MKRLKGTTLILFLLLVLVQGCSSETNEQITQQNETAAKKAYAVEIIHSKEPIIVRRSGVVGFEKSISLSFKTTGFIEILKKQVGSQVQKGEIIGKLDLEEIKAKKNIAEYAVEKAKRDVNRIERLYSDSSATLSQVEDLRTRLNIATKELQIAAFNRDHSVIRSPVQGKITRKFVEEGELIRPGSPVYEISSSEEKVIFNVSVIDREVGLIEIGDSAEVSLDAYPGREITAYVSEIAENPNHQAGTYEVELRVDKSGLSLKKGMFGAAEIYTSRERNYTKIPIEAIVEPKDGGAIIYGLSDEAKRVEERQIQPTYILNNHLIVESNKLLGLTKVFTRGSKHLKNGDIVQVLEE